MIQYVLLKGHGFLIKNNDKDYCSKWICADFELIHILITTLFVYIFYTYKALLCGTWLLPPKEISHCDRSNKGISGPEREQENGDMNGASVSGIR